MNPLTNKSPLEWNWVLGPAQNPNLSLPKGPLLKAPHLAMSVGIVFNKPFGSKNAVRKPWSHRTVSGIFGGGCCVSATKKQVYYICHIYTYTYTICICANIHIYIYDMYMCIYVIYTCILYTKLLWNLLESHLAICPTWNDSTHFKNIFWNTISLDLTVKNFWGADWESCLRRRKCPP